MEAFTCVVDAVTLVESIHHIKKWIYNGYIRLHVPNCTFDRVEELYQASLVPKEVASPPKRSSYKATRKEQPLFDINPRVALEFLLRAQSEKDGSKVTFQLPDEKFTQWKKEEEQALKVEQTPEERPTSFAQALLRKLNISEDNDTNGAKGPAKPRLVARDSAVPKSPWKYHKVPTISSNGVPAPLKPLFSCLLWRLHEYENNPLMPQTFILLTNDQSVRETALKLGLSVKSITELRNFVKSQQAISECMDTFGDLEREFSVKPRDHLIVQPPTDTKVDSITNGSTSSDIKADEMEKLPEQPKIDESGERGVGKIDTQQANESVKEPQIETSDNLPVDIERVKEQEQALEAVKEEGRNADAMIESKGPMPAEIPNEVDGLAAELDMLAEGLKPAVLEPAQEVSVPSAMKSQPVVCEMATQESQTELPEQKEKEVVNGTISAPSAMLNTDGDTDDDEEVVVFNPKSRRFSGQHSKPIESPRVSYIQALETGLPKNSAIQHKPTNLPKEVTRLEMSPLVPPTSAMVEPNNVRDTTKSQNHGVKHARHATPTQQQVQNQVPLYIQYSPSNTAQYQRNQMTAQAKQPNNNVPRSQDENISEAKSQSQGSEPSESSNSVHPHGSPIVRPRNEASTVHGHPSPRAVNRINQVPSKARRQVQKQPTAYPTIIDPDAFDRSYAIAPPINTPEVNKRHSSGRASPRRTPRTPEPEVDYVLKSGSPRGATRGRGKLWVP